MSDWAKRLADQVKTQQARQASDEGKFLEIQRLKKEFGPSLWGAVVAEVKSGCAEMNREVGSNVAVIEETGSNELSVRNENRTPRRLHSHFDADRAQIAWEVSPLQNGGSARGHYEVGIDPKDGRAKLYPLGPGGVNLFAPPSSFSEIVDHMLSALFSN